MDITFLLAVSENRTKEAAFIQRVKSEQSRARNVCCCLHTGLVSWSSSLHVTMISFCLCFSWQRLHKELPLSAAELEDVFDSLDTARTGYLTLEAFSSGFSRFPALK